MFKLKKQLRMKLAQRL